MTAPEPAGDELREFGAHVFALCPRDVAKVLLIVDGPEGIMATCTEADADEIRGLMYRAGAALPGGEQP